MKSSLGEFEEIVLLIVAAQHNEAYGMSIMKTIEVDLERPPADPVDDGFESVERHHGAGPRDFIAARGAQRAFERAGVGDVDRHGRREGGEPRRASRELPLVAREIRQPVGRGA